jgi:hypothetical protein
LSVQVYAVEPYVDKLIDVGLKYNPTSGETAMEYAVTTPLTTFDGNHVIVASEDPIEEPEGKIYRIFQLSLMDLLQFIEGINFDFSWKQ